MIQRCPMVMFIMNLILLANEYRTPIHQRFYMFWRTHCIQRRHDIWKSRFKNSSTSGHMGKAYFILSNLYV